MISWETWFDVIFFGFQDDDEDDEDLEEEEDPNQRFLLSKNSEVVSGGMKFWKSTKFDGHSVEI